MKLTHNDIADIIRLIDSSTLDEFVLDVAGVRIEARRGGAVSSSVRPPPAVTTATPVEPPLPAPVAQTAPLVSPAASQAPDVGPGQAAVTAPMVGTFYRQPSPDSPPFVEVGQRVDVGDALCLVEVMKLYTTLCAECSGTVSAICAEDASLVEYDQVLFVIDKD